MIPVLNPAADLQRADGLVNRALEIDAGYYATHCVKAVVLEGTHRVRDAVVAAERCLALNPSYAGSYRTLAFAVLLSRRAQQDA
jgi:adenylate cyclase